MTIKDTPQILKRVSIRWLPKPAYEDSDTVALNVGGYFMDLRVTTSDGSLQWSRAGERKMIKTDPPTYVWSRIIDSMGSDQSDEATFETMPNGDDLEAGKFFMDGIHHPYEEVWRDVTGSSKGEDPAWIIQSVDGSVFLGKLDGLFLGMRQGVEGSFGVRKESSEATTGRWSVSYENGPVQEIPTADEAVKWETQLKDSGKAVGDTIQVSGKDYVIRGLVMSYWEFS